MTFEELKREAKVHGYNLIKTKTYERLLPCTCGYNRREHWYGVDDTVILKCAKCGKQAKGKSDADVRHNWNVMVIQDD